MTLGGTCLAVWIKGLECALKRVTWLGSAYLGCWRMRGDIGQGPSRSVPWPPWKGATPGARGGPAFRAGPLLTESVSLSLVEGPLCSPRRQPARVHVLRELMAVQLPCGHRTLLWSLVLVGGGPGAGGTALIAGCARASRAHLWEGLLEDLYLRAVPASSRTDPLAFLEASEWSRCEVTPQTGRGELPIVRDLRGIRDGNRVHFTQVYRGLVDLCT